MKTAALNGNMVVEKKESMTIRERIKKYLVENSETFLISSIMLSGGNLYAAYRALHR